MQVISKWPVDVNKEGRDLSLRIRTRVGQIFPKGEQTNLDSTQLPVVQKEIESLERIVNNTNRNKYALYTANYSSATGLTAEHLGQVTSTQFMENMTQVYDSGIIARIKFRLGFK